MGVSWKLGKGWTAGVIGIALNCGSVEFGSGPSPAPHLTNYLWASVPSSVTLMVLRFSAWVGGTSEVGCLGLDSSSVQVHPDWLTTSLNSLLS